MSAETFDAFDEEYDQLFATIDLEMDAHFTRVDAVVHHTNASEPSQASHPTKPASHEGTRSEWINYRRSYTTAEPGKTEQPCGQHSGHTYRFGHIYRTEKTGTPSIADA